MSSKASDDSLPTPASDRAVPSMAQRLRRHFAADIHPGESHLPLILFCATTGYIDAVAFTATIAWAAFQTGNTIQLSIALARTFSGPHAPATSGFLLSDQFALTSLSCFCLGACLLQIGERLGVVKTRGWHIVACLLSTLLSLAGTLCLVDGARYGLGTEAISRTELAWRGARGLAGMGFLSASLGLQGAIAKRLNSAFATTVVLTSVFIDIFAQPHLFHLRRVRARDQRVLAVAALFLGGFAGRALTGAIGGCQALAIGTAFRLLVAFSWCLVPDAPAPRSAVV